MPTSPPPATRNYESRFRLFARLALVVIVTGAVPTEVPAADPTRISPAGGADAGARSGFSTSLNHRLAAVGAPSANVQGIRSGVVRLLRRELDQWATEALLTPSDATTAQEFGSAVSLSEDWLAVGAPGDSEFDPAAGAVYLFNHPSGPWSEVIKLQAPDGVAADRFGASVGLAQISGRAVLAVGADGADAMGNNSGAVYLFEWTASTGWTFQQKLVAIDGSAEDRFGRSVAIHEEKLLVGAWLHSASPSIPSSGLVYAYLYDGATWNFVQSLISPASDAGEGFGLSLDLDGNNAVVGAPFRDRLAPRAGAATVFEWDGQGWNWQVDLESPNQAQDDRFGTSVAIDGDYLVAGIWLADTPHVDSGRTELFRLDPQDGWTFSEAWIPTNPQRSAHFGSAVDLDGSRAIVGAPDEDGAEMDAGGAYEVRVPVPIRFIRGDCNGDSELDVSDAIEGLSRLFVSGLPRCRVACDTNDDGSFDVSDVVRTLGFLFSTTPPPAAPYPDCGLDPTADSLGCEFEPTCS